MTLLPRQAMMAPIVCLAMTIAACTTVPSAVGTLSAGSQATVDGTIASIDTKPWTYDGNAIVLLDTAANGRVSVQLPARWNLCKAGQVDVATDGQVTSGEHGKRRSVLGHRGHGGEAGKDEYQDEGTLHRKSPD